MKSFSEKNPSLSGKNMTKIWHIASRSISRNTGKTVKHPCVISLGRQTSSCKIIANLNFFPPGTNIKFSEAPFVLCGYQESAPLPVILHYNRDEGIISQQTGATVDCKIESVATPLRKVPTARSGFFDSVQRQQRVENVTD
jgi:hypothetical protein